MTIELKPGDVLNDTYRLLELIGRGGMGEVWKAQHERLPKQVAVKVLLETTLTQETSLARFRREAEIASKLNHPNIVDVLDFNTLPGGVPYMVLELLEGESLRERLKKGPLPLEQFVHFMRQVASALAAAHKMGVVHRDLKPENIHICPEQGETGPTERAKVLDFGISKIQGGETALTQESDVLGTPVYMAPEQVSARHGQIDGRTDQFALATICYEILSGTVAFGGHSVIQILGKILEGEPQPLRELKPDLPDNVYTTIDRALSKNAPERYETVIDFVEALATALPIEVGSRPFITGPNVSTSADQARAAARQQAMAVGNAPTMASGPIEKLDPQGLASQPTLHAATENSATGAQKTPIADAETLLGATGPHPNSVSPAADRVSPAQAGAPPPEGQTETDRRDPASSVAAPVQLTTTSGGRTKWLMGGAAVAVGIVAGVVIFLWHSGKKPKPAEKTPSEKLAARNPRPAGHAPIDGGTVSRHDGVTRAGSTGGAVDASVGRPARGPTGLDGGRRAGMERPSKRPTERRASRRPPQRRTGRTPGRETRTRPQQGIPPETQALLNEAKAALRSGKYGVAYRTARKSLYKKSTSTAYAIMAKARCGQGILQGAKAMLRRVSGRRRKRVIRYCRSKGMDLTAQ
jgi:serine/threonine-protein kinase